MFRLIQNLMLSIHIAPFCQTRLDKCCPTQKNLVLLLVAKWKNGQFYKNFGDGLTVMAKWNRNKNEDWTNMRKAQEPKDKSVGTVGAEKAGARANTYTGIKREDLVRKGLSIIYGEDGRGAHLTFWQPRKQDECCPL
jgi:hypothetical protein